MIDRGKFRLGVLLVVFALMPGLAFGRQNVEASTVVTGSIVVMPDGSVRSYTLDHPEKLSKGIVDVVARNVPEWTFRPYRVDGKPAAAKAAMSIRLVARKIAKGRYAVTVRGATFSSGDRGKGHRLKARRVVPRYPRDAIQARVSGTVYLVAKVDRQGRAEDVEAQQVDLRERGPEGLMKRWRKTLADAAATAVRQWTFDRPASGFAPTKPYWIVRIPVSFNLRRDGKAPSGNAYGRWQPYVPGPVNIIPWLDQRQLAARDADVMTAGTIRRVRDEDLQLKTPLGGS